jgi:hypothetical protein
VEWRWSENQLFKNADKLIKALPPSREQFSSNNAIDNCKNDNVDSLKTTTKIFAEGL